MNQEKSKLVLAVIQFLESSSSDSDDYEALITNVKNTKFDESIEQFEQYNDKQVINTNYFIVYYLYIKICLFKFKDIYKINRTTVKFLANEFSKTKFYPSESNYKSSPFTHILLFVW